MCRKRGEDPPDEVAAETAVSGEWIRRMRSEADEQQRSCKRGEDPPNEVAVETAVCGEWIRRMRSEAEVALVVMRAALSSRAINHPRETLHSFDSDVLHIR